MSKSEKKQQSHEAILESAAVLLRKQGIQASSVMDVMKGAGMTVGGFYSHFESKEHLFAQTIRSAGSRMWDRLLGNAPGTTPRERALTVLRRYLSRSHRDHPEAGCILPNAAAEVAREGEPYRTALAEELGGFVDSFAEILGDPKADREKSLALIALMFGALSLSRAVAGTKLSNEFLKAGQALGEQALDAQS
ncbi:MAG: TetR/AcrR family transcriptional regulator, transcriptional repressor for nem operon [Acidobacteriota bacterium]|nr:TetR/AcrR family transcriptional regulator, transcriptional repressor for nem operon [Acidobacteriota bacterium]